MKRLFLVLLIIVQVSWMSGQIVLTIEGQEFNDVITGVSNGISIARSQPTTFTFKNNSVTSVNAQGYMLQAGDEQPGATNRNLDGEVITGNRFTWNGNDEISVTHALFTGYNLNVVIKYNYLDKTPNGIQRKSDGLTDVSGVIAYNIIKNPKVGIVAKGMSGVKIYNNTLYSDKITSETLSRGLIEIQTNQDGGLNAVSEGAKVFNNIFYTKNSIFNIKIYETACLSGFESDYNVFWCESGEPLFNIGATVLTFSQWQAIGYDLHSVVMNPDFNNFNDFVPQVRLDFGKDLGTAFGTGLAKNATWGTVDPQTAAQNGPWQAGARIHEGSGIKVFIYPNPAVDFFYVFIPDLDKPYNILRLYDTNGQEIMRKSLNKGSNTIQIPKQLATGLYNVSLEASDKTRHASKLIIID